MTPPQPIPSDFKPPQAKLPPTKSLRMRYVPEEVPLPHYLIDPDLVARPDFAPQPPPRGFFLHNEMPRIKLRGLGPADNLILRHAITAGLIDPTWYYLSPLIPRSRDLLPNPVGIPGRDLLECDDPPFQPDGLVWYTPPEWLRYH